MMRAKLNLCEYTIDESDSALVAKHDCVPAWAHSRFNRRAECSFQVTSEKQVISFRCIY